MKKIFHILSITILLFACRSTGPHNVYNEAKVKPSMFINKDNGRVLKKAIRAAKRETKKRRREKKKSGYYS